MTSFRPARFAEDKTIEDKTIKHQKGSGKKFFRKLLITFLLLLLAFTLLFLALQWRIRQIGRASFYDPEQVPETYTALVLGAQAYADLVPSRMLQERLDMAITLYKTGKVKTILASGDHATESYDEANTMRLYLLEQGIPAEDIYLDHAGYDTYDSLFRAKMIYQVPSLIICTQEYHAYRAAYIAESLHLNFYTCPVANPTDYSLDYDALRESLARVKAFIETQITRRLPAESGELLPITEIPGQSTWSKDFN